MVRWSSSLALTLALAAAAAGQERNLTAGGRPVDWAQAVARIRAARLVYVGEEHGRPEHHLLQRDVLAAMAEAGPVALGCEYFPQSLQPVLDRFNKGEISIDEFPQAIDWPKTWGHPWEVYRPLFALCAEKHIPVIALNAERDLVKQVRQGGLEKLPLEVLLGLPRMDLANPAHKKRVSEQLQQVHPFPPDMLARYYQAFTLWDEAMADRTAQAFLDDRRPELRMLVVAGRAHIETGTGIPDRVARRFRAPRLVVVCGEAPDDWGDLILQPGPQSGGETPPAGGVERRWF